MLKHISKTPFPQNKLAQEREIPCTENLLWARMCTMHIFPFISSSKQAHIIKGNCEVQRDSTACLGPQVIKDSQNLNPVFPSGSDSKESACNAGDLGSIPGLGRSPGEGNGNPLQDSCLENPMDRGAWQATGHGVTKSWTRPSD